MTSVIILKLLQFQSTLPRGERQEEVAAFKDKLKFQSTLPRGERREQIKSGDENAIDFNPRSREGSDFQVELPCT